MVIKSETKSLKAGSFLRSACPVACTLDILGDKWTLLVIRDIFMGKHRYNQFLESGEGIPTNVLAERLRRLEKAGLVSKSPYQEHPPRYEYFLTKTGRSLGPVIWSIVDWANKYIPGTNRPPRHIARG